MPEMSDCVAKIVKRGECRDCGNPWWYDFPESRGISSCWVCTMCAKTHAKSSSELSTEEPEYIYGPVDTEEKK